MSSQASESAAAVAAEVPAYDQDPRPEGGYGLSVGLSIKVLLLKIVSLGVVDALALYAIFVLVGKHSWVIAAVAVLVMLALNYIYLSPKALPAKYLAPGLIFLAIFQLFVIAYSAYIGFTNYGDGHDGTKGDAISSLEGASLTRVPNSPQYSLTVVQKGTTLALLVTRNGKASVGDAKTPLHSVSGATIIGGKAVSLPGYQTLTLPQLIKNQTAVTKLSVQISAKVSQGAIRTADGSTGYLFQPRLTYNATTNTVTDSVNHTVYKDDGKGEFADAKGDVLRPGWTVRVGLANFRKAFTDSSIRGPLISVTIWTFLFAFLATFTCFALGMFLAITFNHPTMKGKQLYRVILILPYAFPGFLSALVWGGLLNSQFGFINTKLLAGANIQWLTDPTLAKLSVLIVNLWLGFPYMFLVSTGALQSIPDEVIEAATIDGARPWKMFRLVKLPLLLVTMAPILIATFAYNFNNFNVIYLLTGGGPQDINAPINVGSTDILITLVYKIAFQGANGRDYGLASAFSIIIFVFISIISILAFRRTKSLEEIN